MLRVARPEVHHPGRVWQRASAPDADGRDLGRRLQRRGFRALDSELPVVPRSPAAVPNFQARVQRVALAVVPQAPVAAPHIGCGVLDAHMVMCRLAVRSCAPLHNCVLTCQYRHARDVSEWRCSNRLRH